jgi:hypothetical protein
MTDEAEAEQVRESYPVNEKSRQSKQTQVTLQEIIESLKSVQDDIGQIAELTSEERSLVTEFISSLLKFMQPLAASILVEPEQVSDYVGDAVQVSLTQTGHLAVLRQDGQLELKNLSDEKYRDLLIGVLEDVIPKFKQLTSNQKRKVENRIKFLTSVTKEMQKMSKALTAATSE